MSQSQEQSLLEGGAALFTLLGRVMHGVPDGELVRGMAQGGLLDELPLLGAQAAHEVRLRFQPWLRACAARGFDAAFEDVRSDYAGLFLGPRRVKAPLWESVYFNKDRMVFQHETFQVRAMYRRYGLAVDGLSHEPDDQLGYELLFVGHLFGLASQRAGVERDAVMADLRSFTACHPMTWVPKWQAIVHREAPESFYDGYALLVLYALQATEDLVEALLGQSETIAC